jgi:hypothetical protein
MSSETEKTELLAVMHTLEEFVKILVKEFSMVFKDGSNIIKVGPSSKKQFFPY